MDVVAANRCNTIINAGDDAHIVPIICGKKKG